jgi:hypothetical protein
LKRGAEISERRGQVKDRVRGKRDGRVIFGRNGVGRSEIPLFLGTLGLI